jgi:hypothetical protein
MTVKAHIANIDPAFAMRLCALLKAIRSWVRSAELEGVVGADMVRDSFGGRRAYSLLPYTRQ